MSLVQQYFYILEDSEGNQLRAERTPYVFRMEDKDIFLTMRANGEIGRHRARVYGGHVYYLEKRK